MPARPSLPRVAARGSPAGDYWPRAGRRNVSLHWERDRADNCRVDRADPNATVALLGDMDSIRCGSYSVVG
ncbi:hypothetical protein GW17_00008070 [Ensete ventricosum]|nr:hypothetical protein GW17_00008070 [Ensete ventricosum]